MKWGISTNFCVKKLFFYCSRFNAEISIYSQAWFFIYFMQIPAFYVFCRKSSNIFEKNLRTLGFIRKSLYKIFEQINEKFRAGINGYFCIKKILHFNGNVYFCIWYIKIQKKTMDTYKRFEIRVFLGESLAFRYLSIVFFKTNLMIIYI